MHSFEMMFKTSNVISVHLSSNSIENVRKIYSQSTLCSKKTYDHVFDDKLN